MHRRRDKAPPPLELELTHLFAHGLACRQYRPMPSDFGLTRREVVAEIRRCSHAGWTGWELQSRFVDPARVPVDGWCA